MGILKRKFSELDEDSCCSSSSSTSCCGWDLDKQKQDMPPHSPPAPAAFPLRSILKKPKLPAAQNNVCFLQVTVYSFPRCQGFTGVPSRGGATLGMTRRHCEVQTFTIAEYTLEQRHRRREQLRERWRQEKFLEIKEKLITSGTINETGAETLTIDQVPFEEMNININSVELEGGGFLQPYSSKQRQAILLAAGVRRIDKEEKRQLHTLRLSRETCGCDCQGFCEPESCACSLAGIKCQVDRFNFPCGCSQDGCGNTQGRVEFDSRRVRTHHFHTIMRLELERRPKHETHLSKDQSAVSMVNRRG
uniref:Cysteine/serine-rich nuclear protein N-terminal domain-containing protein n=1 Tax=Knipowitschia caucasica TaxID=637954 RepID=A0AAV2JVN4_KNICA